MRRKTKEIKIGGLKIGGDAPITVQSMTNTDTRDAVSTVNQIHRLEQAGCDLVRVAVVDREAGLTLGRIKSRSESLWLPTSILITAWLFSPSSKGSTNCGSIRATLVLLIG